jgi:Fibronectin type III domain
MKRMLSCFLVIASFVVSATFPAGVVQAVDPITVPEFTVSTGANPHLMAVNFTADPRAKYRVLLHTDWSLNGYIISTDYTPGTDLTPIANVSETASCSQSMSDLYDMYGNPFAVRTYCIYLDRGLTFRISLVVVKKSDNSELPESPKSNPIVFMKTPIVSGVQAGSQPEITVSTTSISGATSYVVTVFRNDVEFTSRSNIVPGSKVVIPVEVGHSYKLKVKAIGGTSHNAIYLNSLFTSDHGFRNQQEIYIAKRPDPATNVQVNSNVDAELIVTWERSNSGSPIDRYVVFLSEDRIRWFAAWESLEGTNHTSLTVTGFVTSNSLKGALTLGTKYYASVHVHGSAPNDVIVRTDSVEAGAPLYPPASPENQSFTVSDGRIDASWVAPSFTGGEAIGSYQIEVERGGVAVATKTYDGNATNGFIDGLTNGLTYSIRVRASNSVAVSDSSTQWESVVPVGIPSTSLQSVTNVSRTSARVIAGFSAQGNVGTVELSYIGGGLSRIASFGSTASSTFGDGILLSNLLPGHIYQIRVTAKVGVANYFSNYSRITTTPNAPTNMSVSTTLNTATVTWTDSDMTATRTHSVWAEANGLEVGVGCRNIRRNPLTCTISDLAPNTSYVFKVTLHSVGGDYGNGTSLPATTTAVTKKAQTLSDGSAKLPKMYEGIPSIRLANYFTSSSGLTVGAASTTTNVCIIDNEFLRAQSPGICTLTLTQSGNSIFGEAESLSVSFVIANTQTIAFSLQSVTSKTVTSPAFSITAYAIATSELDVDFDSTTSDVCTVTDGTVSPVSAGTCTIIASQLGSDSFFAAPSATQSITIGRGTQQNIAIPSASGPFNEALELSITGGNGVGVVSFEVNASGNTARCTATRTGVIALEPGNCPVTATKAADANYTSKSSSEQTIVFEKASQTISFIQPADQTEGAVVPVSATASSGAAVTVTSATADVCTVSGTQVTLVSGGLCTLTASQSGTSSFEPATNVTQSFLSNNKLIPATGSVNFDNTQTYFAGSTVQFTVRNDVEGGLQSQVPGTFTWMSDSPQSLRFDNPSSGLATVLGRNGGTGMVQVYYLFRPSAPASDMYKSAMGGRVIQVQLTPQNVDLAPQLVSYLNPAKLDALNVVGSGEVSFSFSPIDEDGHPANTQNALCTITGTSVTRSDPGRCSVRVTVTQDSTYATATRIRDFVFAKKSQRLWIENSQVLDGLTYADRSDPVDLTELVKSSEELTPIVTTSSSSCSVEDMELTVLSAGVCTLTLSENGSSTVSEASYDYSFRIERALQTPLAVVAAEGTLRTPVTLAVSGGDGNGAVSFVASDGSAQSCQITNGVLTSATSGTCLVSAVKAADNSYAEATTTATAITFTRITHTASFSLVSLALMRIGDASVDLAPYGVLSSGRNLLFRSASPETCTVSASRISVIAIGTCVVEASYQEDNEYEGVAAVSSSFDVEAALDVEVALDVLQTPDAQSNTGGGVAVETKTTPVQPTRVRLAVSGSKTLVATWSTVTDVSQSGLSFIATLSPGNIVCRSTTTSCKFTSLKASQSYSVSVVATNGASTSSSMRSATVKPVIVLKVRKSISLRSIIRPPSKGKLKWSVGGGCSIARNNLVARKKLGTCTLTLKTAAVKGVPASTLRAKIQVKK